MPGRVEKTNSTQMQRISTPDLYICCMQKKTQPTNQKKVVQMSLHHPQPAFGSEAPSHKNSTGVETPPQSHACVKSTGFVWLLKSPRVFSLSKFWLRVSVSSSLGAWSLISPGVNGRGVLVMQMPGKRLRSNSSHGSAGISFSSPSHSCPLHSQQCPA